MLKAGSIRKFNQHAFLKRFFLLCIEHYPIYQLWRLNLGYIIADKIICNRIKFDVVHSRDTFFDLNALSDKVFLASDKLMHFGFS
ncbi:hypothetical protein D3C85_1349140 [compost metagenome]